MNRFQIKLQICSSNFNILIVQLKNSQSWQFSYILYGFIAILRTEADLIEKVSLTYSHKTKCGKLSGSQFLYLQVAYVLNLYKLEL